MKYLKLFENFRNDNFYKWFGKSRVVDNDGNSLVVYHDTSKDFSEFSHDTKGSYTKQNKKDVAFHFTDNPKYADSYAETNMVLHPPNDSTIRGRFFDHSKEA